MEKMKMVKVYNKDECIDCLSKLQMAQVVTDNQSEEIETAIMNLE
jgi:hypothetical protein